MDLTSFPGFTQFFPHKMFFSLKLYNPGNFSIILKGGDDISKNYQMKNMQTRLRSVM